MNIYIYPKPSKAKGRFYNSYIDNFYKSILPYKKSTDYGHRNFSALLHLICNLFSNEFFIFNWLENTPFKKYGNIQSFIVIYIVFPILKLRSSKIIWVFHNFSPHQSNNILSKKISALLLENSSLIVTHSNEALFFLNNQSNTNLFFVHHPVTVRPKTSSKSKQYDVLIWGKIEKYKGVLEFLTFLNRNKISHLRIMIVGESSDKEYAAKIIEQCTNSIDYHDKSASFDEISKLISQSKIVLFPYQTDSISSSGALIDTIAMMGNVVGPNKGAFKDLNELGICQVYNNYEEILSLIEVTNPNAAIVNRFIMENTWDNFGIKLRNKINSL